MMASVLLVGKFILSVKTYVAYLYRFWSGTWKKKSDGELSNLCSLATHTHPFNGPLSWATRVSRYQKGRTNLNLLKQMIVIVMIIMIVSGNGISWAICKSTPRCWQENHSNTPPLSVFTGRMPFLLPSHQRHSTEGYLCSLANVHQRRDDGC